MFQINERHIYNTTSYRKLHELKVLLLMATGKSNLEISAILLLAEGTVKFSQISCQKYFEQAGSEGSDSAMSVALKQGPVSL